MWWVDSIITFQKRLSTFHPFHQYLHAQKRDSSGICTCGHVGSNNSVTGLAKPCLYKGENGPDWLKHGLLNGEMKGRETVNRFGRHFQFGLPTQIWMAMSTSQGGQRPRNTGRSEWLDWCEAAGLLDAIRDRLVLVLWLSVVDQRRPNDGPTLRRWPIVKPMLTHS